MKRLCVYVFIAVLLSGTLSIFSSSSIVFAQSIDRQTTTSSPVSRSDLSSKANTLFANFISQLESKQRNPKQIPSLANADAATINAYVSGNKELVRVIGIGRDTFTQLFANPASPSTNPYADFTAALEASKSKINEGQQSISAIRTNSLLRADVTAISSQLNTLGQERQRDLINTGRADEAGDLQNAVGVQRKEQAKKEMVGTCTLWGWNIKICLDEGLTWLVKNTLLQLGGFLVWLAANMFNYAVQVGILEFSSWAPTSLYPVWVIIRQIVSLAIVFVGLYLGLMYLLGRDEKFAKFIPWLVIFALFVNFSYPLTRTAIDISNIISLNVYTSAMGNDVLNTGSKNTAGALIMDRLGLQGLVASATTVADKGNMLDQINSLPGALVAVAFVFYAAYIFLMVTGIMVMRTASLVFLTIASPLLLVDSVLPILGERAQKLRKIFFEQLAVGPVFMVMLALTLKFLSVFSEGPIKSTGLAGIDSGTSQASVVTFFNILMMLIMLHIMIKVTKEVAGGMGQYATDFMGKVGGFGLGVASGGVGLLARQGIGGAAAKFGASKWVQNNKDSLMGRSALSMSNSLANSTFDLRNSKYVAGKMDKVGLGMGMGRKLGFQEASNKRIETIQKLGETAGERYKEDVKDENGNIIHRRGDFTPEGRNAYERYNKNLGGKAIFMSKEQKEKTKELLKANVLKNVAGEETAAKKRADELALAYETIGQHSEDKNKSKADLKTEKDAALDKMLRDLEKMKTLDPMLKGSEAQALSGAINKILDGRKDAELALDKKLKENIARYNNIADTDPNAEGRKAKIFDSMDADEQVKYNQKLSELKNPPVTTANVQTGLQNTEEPLTGDALRMQRLAKVTEGRQQNTSNAQIQMDSTTSVSVENTYKNSQASINAKYDNEIATSGSNSSIVDDKGLPTRKAPTTEQVNDIEGRRKNELASASSNFQSSMKSVEENITNYEKAVTKEQESAFKVTERVNKLGGVEVDLTPTSSEVSADLSRVSQENRAAAAAAARANMAENGSFHDKLSALRKAGGTQPGGAFSGTAQVRPTPVTPSSNQAKFKSDSPSATV